MAIDGFHRSQKSTSTASGASGNADQSTAGLRTGAAGTVRCAMVVDHAHEVVPEPTVNREQAVTDRCGRREPLQSPVTCSKSVPSVNNRQPHRGSNGRPVPL